MDLIFNNSLPKHNFIKYDILRDDLLDNILTKEIDQQVFLKNPRYEFFLTYNLDLFSKIESVSTPLGIIANCIMGIKPYQKGKGQPKLLIM